MRLFVISICVLFHMKKIIYFSIFFPFPYHQYRIVLDHKRKKKKHTFGAYGETLHIPWKSTL